MWRIYFRREDILPNAVVAGGVAMYVQQDLARKYVVQLLVATRLALPYRFILYACSLLYSNQFDVSSSNEHTSHTSSLMDAPLNVAIVSQWRIGPTNTRIMA